MDVFDAMKGRRSCRSFLPDPVDESLIGRILEAATWAPSPLNAQPWEFVVVTDAGLKEKIREESERCKAWAREESGWNWLDTYSVDFLESVPALVAVVGNPKKTGMDQFQEDGNVAYQHACAAAIQNMLLAAHALGLGSLWFTLFDRGRVTEILEIDSAHTLVGLVCLGTPDKAPRDIPRKAAGDKTRTLG